MPTSGTSRAQPSLRQPTISVMQPPHNEVRLGLRRYCTSRNTAAVADRVVNCFQLFKQPLQRASCSNTAMVPKPCSEAGPAPRTVEPSDVNGLVASKLDSAPTAAWPAPCRSSPATPRSLRITDDPSRSCVDDGSRAMQVTVPTAGKFACGGRSSPSLTSD